MIICDEFQLSLYADNMLSARDTRQLSEHLSQCPDCRESLETLKKLKDDLKNFDEVELPTGFHEDIMAAVRESDNQRIDFVTERLQDRKLKTKLTRDRLLPQPQFFGRLGTVAAGLLITLVVFGGIGSYINYMPMQYDGASSAGSGAAAPAPAPAAAPSEMLADIDAGTVMYDSAPAAESSPPMVADAAPYAAAPAPMMTAGRIMEDGIGRRAEPEAYEYNAAEGQWSVEERQLNLENAEWALSGRVGQREAITFSVTAPTTFGASAATYSIMNYDISIEVEDFDLTVAASRHLPGYNISSNMNNYGEYHKQYNMMRSVGRADYERLKSELRALGKVTSDSESVSVVYAGIVDTDARIRAREVEMSRLFELLELSDSVEAMVMISQRLEQTGRMLDGLRSQKLQYERSVADATVHISFYYRDSAPMYEPIATFGERLNASFIMSFNTTFEFVENAAEFVALIGFPLIIICAIGLIVWGVLRRKRVKHDE